jgi:hypothetical protein
MLSAATSSSKESAKSSVKNYEYYPDYNQPFEPFVARAACIKAITVCNSYFVRHIFHLAFISQYMSDQQLCD